MIMLVWQRKETCLADYLDNLSLLIGPVTGHRGPMHMPDISLVIVRLGSMHCAAVIPEDKVTASPFMAMNEPGTGAMCEQPFQQRRAFPGL